MRRLLEKFSDLDFDKDEYTECKKESKPYIDRVEKSNINSDKNEYTLEQIKEYYQTYLRNHKTCSWPDFVKANRLKMIPWMCEDTFEVPDMLEYLKKRRRNEMGESSIKKLAQKEVTEVFSECFDEAFFGLSDEQCRIEQFRYKSEVLEIRMNLFKRNLFMNITRIFFCLEQHGSNLRNRGCRNMQ